MDPAIRTLASKVEVHATQCLFVAALDLTSGFFSYNLHLPFGAPTGLFSLTGIYGAARHNVIFVSLFAIYEIINLCVQISLFTTLTLCLMDKEIEGKFEQVVGVNMDNYDYTVGLFFLGLSALYKFFVTFLFFRFRHELIYARRVTEHLLEG